jgi:tetratricopeptide (TPR) repeat protein
MRFRDCLLAAALASAAGRGSPAEQEGPAARASAAYEAGDWARARELYQKMAEEHPETARLWFRLAESLAHLGQLDLALETLDRAVRSGAPPQFAEFRVAAIYAQKGDREKAFEHLESAVDSGYNQPEELDRNPFLAALAGDPRFTRFRAQAGRNRTPCLNRAENRQFDFWLGTWRVLTTEGGVPAGRSRIEPILGACVIEENWQSDGNPYAGKSYNTYNAALGRWEQYWVDNSGGNIFFYGGLKDGVMDYWTDEIPQPSGPPLKRHLRFFTLAPDRVRQLSQGSTDGGKTWTTEYDFTYLRE